MAQRDNGHFLRYLAGPSATSGPTGRCPMKPNTPLGPDQVNVLLLSEYHARGSVARGAALRSRLHPTARQKVIVAAKREACIGFLSI
jgi:uncharacterized membrane protein